jgi:phosphopantetheinyl transferase
MLLDKDTIHLDEITVYFWKIEETRKELVDLCNKVGVDVSHTTEIKSTQRACEKLATLLTIALTLGNKTQLCHTDEGAPFIKNSKMHISISHSAHMVAVAFSPNPIGIDIEHKAEQVLRVREKFLNNRELALIGNKDKDINLMFWTAKEAVYKVHSRKGIDFKNDIYQDTRVKSVFRATDGQKKVPYKVEHYQYDENFMIAIATPKIVKSKNNNI